MTASKVVLEVLRVEDFVVLEAPRALGDFVGKFWLELSAKITLEYQFRVQRYISVSKVGTGEIFILRDCYRKRVKKDR